MGLPRLLAMRSVLSLALLALTSCASSAFDRAPMTCETGSGTVRGFDREEVAEVGRLVSELCPRIDQILRPERTEPVRLVVLDTAADPYAKAYTHEFVREGRIVDRFIVVGSEAKYLRGFIVAHELVHWSADGAWDRLPLVLEEGLADLIASQLDPIGREAKLYDLARVPAAENFGEIEAALGVSRETWAALVPAERYRAYWVGYIVTNRIGVEGLRELCAEAEAEGLRTVPIERVLVRAGLGTDVRAWNAALPE